jgi:tRNA (guanine9-N1)-methyltransferase
MSKPESTSEIPPTEQPAAKTEEKPLKFDQYNHQNVKPVIPEGMSKSQWKKQQKRLKFQQDKITFKDVRKEKQKKSREARRAKIDEYKARGEEIPQELLTTKSRLPAVQVNNGGTILMDCSFDDLMTEKEVTSLSTQITRAYSAVRLAPITSTLTIAPFNKNLKKRFTEDMKKSGYWNWKNVEFQEEDFTIDDPSKAIYLSADSDEVLEELDPSITYIIGGIVDKNRHKLICKEKAEGLGIKTARLPIGEHVKLNGRTVLTTGHVVEILLKWYEFKDWKKVFESVLPSRKLGLTPPKKSASTEPVEENQQSGEQQEAAETAE